MLRAMAYRRGGLRVANERSPIREGLGRSAHETLTATFSLYTGNKEREDASKLTKSGAKKPRRSGRDVTGCAGRGPTQRRPAVFSRPPNRADGYIMRAR